MAKTLCGLCSSHQPDSYFCRRIGLCTAYPATSIPSTTKSAADKDSRQQAPLPGAAVRTGGEGVRGGAGRGGGSGYRRAVRVGQGVPANHCAGQAAATTAQRRPGRALRAENAVLVVRRRLAVLLKLQKMVVAQSELPGEARQDRQLLQH